MHETMGLTRQRVWARSDPPEPVIRKTFSRYPRPGFVGENYSKSRVVLVGINPGSGEGRAEEEFNDRDKELGKFLKAFKQAGSNQNWDALMRAEGMDMKYYKLDWAIRGALERLGLTRDEIAFINVVPFSTQKPSHINAVAWESSIYNHFLPLIEALNPKRTVWLGKTAHDKFTKYSDKKLQNSVVVNRQRNKPMSERFMELEKAIHHL